MSKRRPVTIKILASADASPSTLFGLIGVLSSVGIGWEIFVTGKPVDRKFDVRIVGPTKEPFRCAGDVLVSTHFSVEEAQDADIAPHVASFVIPAAPPPKDFDEREIQWLARQLSSGSIIAAACTGAVMLAKSELLNSYEATTHWAHRDLFRIHYPEVRLNLSQNLCVSGHDNRIVTSGGTKAWQELALYLTTRFSSVEHAANTAKFWLIPNREEGLEVGRQSFC